MELENSNAVSGMDAAAETEDEFVLGPEDYEISDDDGGSGHEPEQGEGAPQEGTEDKPEEPAGAEPTYKVKYNGVEQDLPVSELVTLAQKGMNYDKVAAQAREQGPEVQMVRQAIAQSGMDAQTFFDQWRQGLDAAAMQQQIDAGMTPEAAARFVAMERQMQVQQAEERAATEDARVRAGVMDFAEAYPDVKEFPPEVMALMEQGVPPLYAYRSYENAQLRARVQELETGAAAKAADQRNRARAPGSAAGMADGEENDPFLAGMREAMNNY